VSFFSLTLFTNFSSTGKATLIHSVPVPIKPLFIYLALIAARIWWVHRRVIGITTGGGNLAPAAVVIIESGAIYSLCLVLLLSLYLSGSYAQYILLDTVSSRLSPYILNVI
jgi:hypothetical protein